MWIYKSNWSNNGKSFSYGHFSQVNWLKKNVMSTHNASKFDWAKEVINSCSETNCKVNTFYDSIEMGIFFFSTCVRNVFIPGLCTHFQPRFQRIKKKKGKKWNNKPFLCWNLKVFAQKQGSISLSDGRKIACRFLFLWNKGRQD